MSISKEEEISRYCRACTTEIDNGGIYLFEENSKILEIFANCTTLEIDKFDNLPAYICEKCNSIITTFQQFQLTCANSDLYFRQLLLCSIEVKNEILAEEEGIVELPVVVPAEESIITSFKHESSKSPKNESVKLTKHHSLFECENCGKHFKKKHLLEGHLRNHIGLKAFQCDLCNKSYEKYNRLTCHKRMHQRIDNAFGPQRQFQCDQVNCKKSYNHLKSLRDHINAQHFNIKRNYGAKKDEGSTKYECLHCKKKFKKVESLDGHIRQHQGLEPFECNLCGSTFKKLRSLTLHTDAKHNESFQKIPCDYKDCDKAFTTKHGLKEHISNIHLGIKKPKIPSHISYICELCGKSFKNKTSLKKHSYCHTGERPFSCTYCPKKFTVKDKLKNHIMRHENVKNFECSHCGMRKVTMAELRIHMNSHTMDKVYPCPQCSAVFSRDGNAKRHFRIVHRGYKPYKCETCQQSFSKKETLKHHEMTHSGEKPHACNICNKRFIQPIALKKHLKVHNKPVLRPIDAELISNIAAISTVNDLTFSMSQ